MGSPSTIGDALGFGGYWGLTEEEIAEWLEPDEGDGPPAAPEVPPSRWEVDGQAGPSAPGASPVRFGGFVEGAEFFDHGFFSLSTPEARDTLMVVPALLHMPRDDLDADAAKLVAVSVGISYTEYAANTAHIPHTAFTAASGTLSAACGRVSFALGLKGPSVSVDTACSSSLVGAHLAATSFIPGGCARALAAGVNLTLRAETAAILSMAGMLASDGRCKTLDAAADGYARGEACVVNLLELELPPSCSALSSSDSSAWPAALLVGSAVNQDGRSSSLTAPNGPSQQAAIRAALAAGAVAGGTVQVLEMHGTGTPLGDPIEVGAALAALHARNASTAAACPLEMQAAKSRLLHTEPAAGAVGLAALVQRLGPGAGHVTLHLRTVNPHVAGVVEGRQLGDRSLRMHRQQAPEPFCAVGSQVVGSVSSFAYQGTNSHAVLSAFPPAASWTLAPPQPWQRIRLWYQVTSHPLLWSFAAFSAPPAVCMECPLGRPALAWLADHSMQGRSLVPGTVLLEMASAAGQLLLSAEQVRNPTAAINATFLQPLALAECATDAVLVCSIQLPAGAAAISSRTFGSSSTPLHLAAELHAAKFVQHLEASSSCTVSGTASGALPTAPRHTAAILDALSEKLSGRFGSPCTGGLVACLPGEACRYVEFWVHPALAGAPLQLIATTQSGAAAQSGIDHLSLGVATEAGTVAPAAVGAYAPLQRAAVGVRAAALFTPFDDASSSLACSHSLTSDGCGSDPVLVVKDCFLKPIKMWAPFSPQAGPAAPPRAPTPAAMLPRVVPGSVAEVQGVLLAVASQLLGGAEIFPDDPLMARGLDSIDAVELRNVVADRFGIDVPATAAFDYPTPAALAAFVAARLGSAHSPEQTGTEPQLGQEQEQTDGNFDGLSFSGASLPSTSLRSQQQQTRTSVQWGAGTPAIIAGWSAAVASPGDPHTIPYDRWDVEFNWTSQAADQTVQVAGQRFAAWVDRAAYFDEGAFRLGRTDAVGLDPQSRLLLERCWAAVRDARLPGAAHSSTGVYVGCVWSEYQTLQEQLLLPPSVASLTGSGLTFLAGRASYTFGFQGKAASIAFPSNLQTRLKAWSACGNHLLSSPLHYSLPALVLAALALPHQTGMDVTVLVRTAIAAAAASPHQIGLVSLHGTGTALGDPIEANALGHALASRGEHPVALASTKACFGHTEGAAGIQGAMLAALALQMQAVPPVMHSRTLNPYVAAALEEWKARPLIQALVPRASSAWPSSSPPHGGWSSGAFSQLGGCSSFGMSGVNAHGLLSEPSRGSYGFGQRGKCTRLPWRRSCHWPLPARYLAGRAIVDQPGTTARFQAPLQSPHLAFLLDHRVQGTAILPGAGMLEMCTASARCLWDSGSGPIGVLGLSRAAIPTPAVLTASGRTRVIAGIGAYLAVEPRAQFLLFPLPFLLRSDLVVFRHAAALGMASPRAASHLHGSVVVTGGLGALGSIVACWLAGWSSCDLWLLGRSGRTGGEPLPSQLYASNGSVICTKGDVAALDSQLFVNISAGSLRTEFSANSALDAWACAAQGAGRPILIRNRVYMERMERMGFALLDPALGLAVMSGLLHELARETNIWSFTRGVVMANRFLWANLARSLPGAAATSGSSRQEEDSVLPAILSALSALGAAAVAQDQPFMDAGLDSMGMVQLRNELMDTFRVDLPSTATFDHPTPAALARFIAQRLADARNVPPPALESGYAKVVGLSCTFPGAAMSKSVTGFWQTAASGKMAVRFGAFLAAVDFFDAALFRLAPGEAAAMDPQGRVLLEQAHLALTDAAGRLGRRVGHDTGVYVGVMHIEFVQYLASLGTRLTPPVVTGSGMEYLAGRLSYSFDLAGPCLAVHTACSSSLVATHLAHAGLLTGEVSYAAAAGVQLVMLPGTMSAISALSALSPVGRCKMFDASGDGYGRGDGCAVAVLRCRTEERPPAAKTSMAVLRATIVNQDGRSSSMTAPSGPAQSALVSAALARAAAAPEEVSSVAVHGTGTPLGDPIETGALGAALGSPGTTRQHLRAVALVSAKSCYGHTEGAAGLTGLLLATQVVGHKAVPPVMHLRATNPHVESSFADWQKTYGLAASVPRAAAPSPSDGTVEAPCQLAGTSSFGMSGVNAHALLLLDGPKSSQDYAAGLALLRREMHWPLPRAPCSWICALPPWRFCMTASSVLAYHGMSGDGLMRMSGLRLTSLPVNKCSYVLDWRRMPVEHEDMREVVWLLLSSQDCSLGSLCDVSLGAGGVGSVSARYDLMPRVSSVTEQQQPRQKLYLGPNTQFVASCQHHMHALLRAAEADHLFLVQPELPQDDDVIVAGSPLSAIDRTFGELLDAASMAWAYVSHGLVAAGQSAGHAPRLSLVTRSQLLMPVHSKHPSRTELFGLAQGLARTLFMEGREAFGPTIDLPSKSAAGSSMPNCRSELLAPSKLAWLLGQLGEYCYAVRQGAAVFVVHRDAGQPSHGAGLAAWAHEELPAIQLLAHAAGVSGYDLLPDLTAETFASVAGPKGWQAAGQPATAVAFGPFQHIGMAAELSGSMEAVGLRPLDGSAMLPAFVEAGVLPRCVHARLDVARFSQINTAKGPWRFLDDLAASLASPAAVGQLYGAQPTPPTIWTPVPASQEERQPPRAPVRLEDLEQAVTSIAVEVLGASVLDGAGQFAAGTIDSLSAVDLSNRLGAVLGLDLPATLAFDYPSVPAMAAFLLTKEFGEPQLRARFGGFLTGVDLFDASLFSLRSAEAELMDPQQRLLLEVSWEVLRAVLHQQSAHAVNFSTGVFVGIQQMEYSGLTALHSPGMLAHDGRCKTLDVRADGYGRAEACVVLHLSAAGPPSADCAVVLCGTFVNQDGRSSSLTAPNGPAQQRVISGALEAANLRPTQVTALEMHGTALHLSAAKSCFGHAEPASGAIGMARAVDQLALDSGCPIGGLTTVTVNPYVASTLAELYASSRRPLCMPRQGTNAHVLIGGFYSPPGNDGELFEAALWHRQRHWFAAVPHAWLLWGMASHSHQPGASAMVLMEGKLAWAGSAYIWDHEVRGKKLFPPAALLELGLATASGAMEPPVAECLALSVFQAVVSSVHVASSTGQVLHLGDIQTKPLTNPSNTVDNLMAGLDAVPSPTEYQAGLAAASKQDLYAAQQQVLRIVSKLLGGVDVPLDQPLMAAGLDSLGAIELRSTLNSAFQLDLPATITFDLPTVVETSHTVTPMQKEAELQPYQLPPQRQLVQPQQKGTQALAVVGVAGRYPSTSRKPADLAAFWQAVVSAADLPCLVPTQRWDADQHYSPNPASNHTMITRFGSFVDDIDAFDLNLFRLASSEALALDPQARQLLEQAHLALADARPATGNLLETNTGVYVGCIAAEYLALQAGLGLKASPALVTGSGGCYLAGRLSYSFGLAGPCISVDTACSSSLVATHLGHASLMACTTQAVVAAGTNAILLPGTTIGISALGALSPSARCKTLDASAGGLCLTSKKQIK
eukprot:scaffold26.g3342.t1